MKIRLSDVLSIPNNTVIKKAVFEPDEVEFQGNIYKVIDKEEFDLTLKGLDKYTVEVTANFDIKVVLLCGRCLKELPTIFSIDINEVIDTEEKETEDLLEDVFYVENGVLDVDALILDELIPMLPIQTLCNEECKGLCKICGCNLNERECGCDRHIMDPRMAIFGEVFNQIQ